MNRLFRCRWRMNVVWPQALLLSWVLPALFSCAMHCPSRSGSGSLTLFSVKVPADATTESLLPPEFQLGKGEVVSHQTCAITREGRFTFTRTIESEIGYLGVDLAPLDAGTAERLSLEPFSGILVTHVEKDGPGYRAGLRADDVILRLGEDAAQSVERLQYLIEKSPPDSPVEVEFVQKGKKVATRIALGSVTQIVRSKTIQRELPLLDDMNRTGMKLVEIPGDLRPFLAGKDIAPSGLLVVEILPGGPAFFSKLRTRDFLVSVGEQFVNTLSEYRAITGSSSAGTRLTVVARRGEQRIQTEVRLVDDARDKGGFNLLDLITYKSRPEGTEFKLFWWGWLFNYRSCHSVHEKEAKSEHRTERGWGLVLDLLRYRGRPGKKEIRVAWILPITFGS